RALCAVPARGVSIRSLSLPPASQEETRRLVRMQVERAFPLSPEQLAWAWQEFGSADGALPGGAQEMREVGLIGLRREVLDDYDAILSGCGLDTTYSVGLIAASALCPPAGRSWVIDIGRVCSEMLELEGDRPVEVRTIPWGGEDVTAAIQGALGIDRDAAEARKLGWRGSRADPGGNGALSGEDALGAAIESALHAFVKMIGEAWSRSQGEDRSPGPRRVFLVGGGSRLAGIGEGLTQAAGGAIECGTIEIEGLPGRSAVTLGLEERSRDGRLAMEFQPRSAPAGEAPAEGRPATIPWLLLAAALLLVSLSLRYVSPILGIPALEERIAETERELQERPSIDRELAFLEHLEESRLPVLEVLAALGEAIPKSTRIDDFSISRRGDISIGGKVEGFRQANDLRRKLVLSGWFSQAVLQELVPEDQNIRFRLTARLVRPGARTTPPPSVEGVAEDEKSAQPTAGAGQGVGGESGDPAASTAGGEQAQGGEDAAASVSSVEGAPEDSTTPPGAAAPGNAPVTAEGRSTPADPQDSPGPESP
ncbi:MAG: PilN domain-containing protein, partial [Planctomycetota bacterium]